MENFSDVIVVGAGPSGSFSALNIAKHGYKVTVFEEHTEIGVPTHCTGHISINGLKRLGLYPLPNKIVENTYSGATFYSPRGNRFSVHFSQPVTCLINRVLFDKYIAELARKYGVQYCLNSHVKSILIKDNFVKGVKSDSRTNAEQNFLANLTIDAEGISSKLLASAGLLRPKSRMFVNGAHAEVENVDYVMQDSVEVFLGENYAPGFFAWIAPKKDNRAKVGLAVSKGNPREYLRKFMLRHPVASKRLRNAKILSSSFHPIVISGPISKTYTNGFLAVGDSAGHVKPTTGGGIVFGMTCAKVAADVTIEALRRNDFSADFLSNYQKRCRKVFGFDVNAMIRLRKMFNKMSDDEIDRLIRLCARLDLDRTTLKFEDVDRQGRLFLALLSSPKMMFAILYFLLTANA